MYKELQRSSTRISTTLNIHCKSLTRVKSPGYQKKTTPTGVYTLDGFPPVPGERYLSTQAKCRVTRFVRILHLVAHAKYVPKPSVEFHYIGQE